MHGIAFKVSIIKIEGTWGGHSFSVIEVWVGRGRKRTCSLHRFSVKFLFLSFQTMMNECSIFQCNFFRGKFAIDCQGKNWLISCSCNSIFLRYFRRQIAAKIHFIWHGEFLLVWLLLQQNFVFVISHMNSNWFESGQLITATKCEIVAWDTSPHNVLPRVSGPLFYFNGMF